MVQDTVMPDRGGGSGSPSTAAHSAPGRGMTCSYAGCTVPTPGIPFCMTHLSLLKAPHRAQARPSPVFYNTPPTATPGLQDARPHKLSGAYVMRKSASHASMRPSPFMSSSSGNGHYTPSERPPSMPWPPAQAVQQQPCRQLATQCQHARDDKAFYNTRGHAPYIPSALATPVESPPFSRRNGTGRNDREVHSGVHNYAQQEALRTPRSRSREADTPSSTTPQQSSQHGPNSYVPSAQYRVSYLLGRLQAQTQAAAMRNESQPTPSLSCRTQPQQAQPNFLLDTYVYAQDASVCPLPPPPGIKVSSASDIADAADAASTAAALEASYAAAMAASERQTGQNSQSNQNKHNPSAPSYVYAYIDPRVHWTRARSKEWHADKQAEIKARGGRKANVGMAAQRTARQKLHAVSTVQASSTPASSVLSPEPAVAASGVPCAWEGRLPDSVLDNKAWTDLLGTFAHDEEKRLRRAQRLAQQYQQRYGT